MFPSLSNELPPTALGTAVPEDLGSFLACHLNHVRQSSTDIQQVDFDDGLVSKDHRHFWEMMNNLRAEFASTSDILVC
jgi:hypothetical protein